jgi:hypothetical protein
MSQTPFLAIFLSVAVLAATSAREEICFLWATITLFPDLFEAQKSA